MEDRKIDNALITATFLGIEDRGFLTAWLTLEGEFGGQGFGGYRLSGPFCALFVSRVLETVGAEKWEDLKGKYVRIEHDLGKIYRLGNIIKDEWFNPRAEFETLTSRNEGMA